MAYLKDIDQLQVEITVALERMGVGPQGVETINHLFEGKHPTVDAEAVALGVPTVHVDRAQKDNYLYYKTPLPMDVRNTYYRVKGHGGVDDEKNVWLLAADGQGSKVVDQAVARAARKVGIRHLHEGKLDFTLFYYPPEHVIERLVEVDILIAPPGLYFEQALVADWTVGWKYRAVVVYETPKELPPMPALKVTEPVVESDWTQALDLL